MILLRKCRRKTETTLFKYRYITLHTAKLKVDKLIRFARDTKSDTDVVSFGECHHQVIANLINNQQHMVPAHTRKPGLGHKAG